MNNDIPFCRKCHTRESVKLRRRIISSGSEQVYWRCVKCDCSASIGAPAIGKKVIDAWTKSGKLKAADLSAIPLVNDNRVTCAVCGHSGAEYHHWLPQALADAVKNYNDWPGAYLCKGCHDTWHELVTPYLPGRGATKLAEFTKGRYL